MTVGQENSLNQWAVQQYDAVSKAAFDVRDNVQLRKTVESAESFNAGVVKIMKDAGIPDKFLVGLGGEDVGTTEWLATVEGLAEAGAELAADTAISGFLTYIGQPQWIPAAVGGVKKIRKTFDQIRVDANDARVELMNEGSWVMINNGPPPEAEIGYKEGIRRRMFGFSTDKGPPPDRISVGFFISPAAKGYVKVFNFFTFRDEDQRVLNVAPASAQIQAEVQQNNIMRGVRALHMSKGDGPDPKMSVEVPTDPGTEVIYNDLLYNIVQAEGSDAVIEDIHGQRLVVSIDELQRGRVTHTNAWNYRKGEEFNTGFDADGSAKVFSGQWVWIPARPVLVKSGATNFELAVVWKLERDGAHVFNAFDGNLVVVDEVWPISFNLSDSFNAKKKYTQFRMAAIEGVNTHTYSLGTDELLVCIGGTQDAQMGFPKKDTPGEVVRHRVEPEILETAGQEAVKDKIDDAVEISRGDNVSSGKALRMIAVDTYPDEELDESRMGGNSLFAYGAMAAAVLFLFNSIEGL